MVEQTMNALGDVRVDGKIRVRLQLVIRDLHVDRDGELVIGVNESRRLDVRYRRPKTHELETGAEMAPPLSLGDTMCEAAGEWPVSDRNRDALETLARENIELTERIVVFGSVGGTGMPAWDAIPEELQQLLAAIESELGNAAALTYRLLRWFLALVGDHAPFRFWSFAWSPDGSQWQGLPRGTPLRSATFVPTLQPIPVYAESIEKAIKAGRDEPIAHEMLREAAQHLLTSPRSALVIGIAAAETGFKEFVSRNAPSVSWLVVESPTPPLLPLLTEFFPELLAELKAIQILQFAKGKDTNREYNDPVLRELKRGLDMRDVLVQRPSAAPRSEDVEPVLFAVRDLLGLLDHYSGGTPLGRSFISVATRRVWRQTDAKKPT